MDEEWLLYWYCCKEAGNGSLALEKIHDISWVFLILDYYTLNYKTRKEYLHYEDRMGLH